MKVICPSCLATNNVPKMEIYKKQIAANAKHPYSTHTP